MRSLVVIFTLLVIVSSCNKRTILPTVIHSSDSTNTEIRYKVIKEKDTVYLEVPAQSAERTTQDSSSHLETDFATSDARILEDGTLYHDLNNKPQKRPVETEKEIIYKDTTIYKERKVEIPVPVERELTKWEKISLKWFPYSLTVIFLILTYVLRKPLMTLIRRFL